MSSTSLMKSLAKISIFSLWGILIATVYYKVGHIENFESAATTTKVGLIGMLAWILGLYAAYKGALLLGKQYRDTIGLPSVIGLFFLELLLLCLLFMGGAGMVLFMKIVGYLILPTSILFLVGNFGEFLLKKGDTEFSSRSSGYRFMISVALGLSSLLFVLSILLSVYLFNLITVGITLLIFSVLARKEIADSAKSLWNFRIRLGESAGSSYTLLCEFFFIILSLLLSANFISIVRPMPIGWDDLGVYMNFPKMLAENGGIQNMGVVAWQSLTGIGFLFRSAPQAFFMNQIGGMLCVVFLIVGLGSLIKTFSGEKKFAFAPLPLIAATVFMALPMIVFEQAKDMKLDPGLFAISIAVLFGTYELLSRREAPGRNLFVQIAAIGIIAGIAFAIKPTSLMLFIALAGLFLYEFIGLLGFFGFFAFFIGLFTKLKLWGMMNVVYPQGNDALLSWVGLSAMAVWIILIAAATLFSIKKEDRSRMIKNALIITATFAVGILAMMAPWFAKNLYETYKVGNPMNIGNLLGGYSRSYTVDYSSIRSDAKEIEARVAVENEAAAKSGTTTNEDFGRYFGYESGINNHLKLPYNLTFQKNQQGEYTDISFIFLALLPAIFLFLSFQNIMGIIGVIVWLGFWAMYFFIPDTAAIITAFFGSFDLPIGYVPLAALLFAPFVWAHFTVKKDEESGKLFLRNFAFLSMYSFIFVIAAFGVVWYGIALYGCFLLAAIISIAHANEGDADESVHVTKAITVFAVIAVIMIYLLRSAVPHAWTNIATAGFEEFKNGRLTQNEAIFAYHSDYLNILATLNQKDPGFISQFVAADASPALQKLLEGKVSTTTKSYDFDALMKEIEWLSAADVTGISSSDLISLKNDARKMRMELYSKILYPSADERNNAPIYRIGTFLTYFISDSKFRYFDDSLVGNFYTYFADEDREVTVDRIAKSGLKYFLVDLNAATIDRDPRHNLTDRFESLLNTFPSKKLRLIQTDSTCLRVALEELRAGNISESDYKILAGVNHESYGKTADGADGVIPRTQKLAGCRAYVANLVKTKRIDSTHFSYLLPIAEYVTKKSITKDSDILALVSKAVDHGWLALFEVVDTEGK